MAEDCLGGFGDSGSILDKMDGRRALDGPALPNCSLNPDKPLPDCDNSRQRHSEPFLVAGSNRAPDAIRGDVGRHKPPEDGNR